MIREYEGIVISTVDYKESSKIINIFTKNDGIIGVVARGVRKINSKIRAAGSILCYGVFMVNERGNNGLGNLVDVDIINSFKLIKRDIIKLNYATYLLELSSKCYKHDDNISIYDILIGGLIKINDGFDPHIISNIVELKYLDFLGIRPDIDGCVSCGKTDDIVTISSYKGGLICKECFRDDEVYNIKTIKLIRLFYYVDISKITKLDISDNIKDEIDRFIGDYYDRYSGLYLKSKSFLKETLKMN